MTDTPTFEQSKPFERKYIQTGTERDFVNVPLNDDERKELNDIKAIFRCPKDATVIKKCIEYVHGVTQAQSTRLFFEWLSESRRLR